MTGDGSLRAALFAAVVRRDADELAELCARNLDEIVAEFASWTRVPEEIRGDQEAAQAWAQSVIAIAQQLAALGRPEPLASISGDGDDSPLDRWYDGFAEATNLADAGERQASMSIVLAILDEMQGTFGPDVDYVRTKAYGLLGTNLFRLGDLDGAEVATQRALEDAERQSDRETVRIYTENLAIVAAARESADVTGALDWRARIASAQDLSDDAHYDESNRMLEEVAAALDEPGAADADTYRGKVYGLLGLNCFRLGDAAEARRWTERAHEACERAGDDFGVTIYGANLDVIDAHG